MTLQTKIIAALAIAIVCTMAGFRIGYGLAAGKAAAAALEAEREAAAKHQADSAKVAALSADLERARADKARQDKTIAKEIHRYEALVPAVRRCQLDGHWRMLHDAAATGTATSTAGLADDAAQPIADAAALDTVAGNYEACRDWRDQLTGLQQYVRTILTPTIP